MKKFVVVFFLLGLTALAHAQMLNPIKWTFTSKKIDAKTFEVHLLASIMPGWHLYSQTQPADAINIPTEITFNNHPLVSLDGKAKEDGKMEVYTDKRLGISANQYAMQVEFVQKVKLKAPARTNITGSVEYQTCDDKKCLPPQKQSFNIALN